MTDRPYPLRYVHLSNALTYSSLVAGLAAAWAAVQFRSWNLPGALIAFCVLVDTFDGRFARRFKRTENQAAFGIEIDSLADAVVFGFVPVACMIPLLNWDIPAAGCVLWIAAAALYVISALTRLGCYNLHQATADRFTGLPTTLAALFLAAFFLLSPTILGSAMALVLCAAVMSLPLPLPRPRRLGFGIFIGLVLLVLALHVLEVLR